VTYTQIDTHEPFAVRPFFKSRNFGRLIAGALGGAIFALGGCQTVPKPPEIVAVPANSFVQQWEAEIPRIKSDPIVAMYLRGTTLYAYAKSNEVYGFSAAGGKMVFSDQVVPSTSPLRAPTLLPDNKVVFPAADTLVEYDQAGRRIQAIPLTKPTHSSGVAVGYTYYVGLDSPTGGRLAALDLTPRVPTEEQINEAKRLQISLEAEIDRTSTKWEVLTVAAIEGAPVYYQGVIYAGTLDGKVWAISEEGSGIWSLPNGAHVFQADGPIRADLQIDDIGIYVASEDGNLYCVDRGSGRIKWTYFGGAPLDTTPVVTPSVVYQYVPGTGLVAVNKHALGTAKAKWVNPDAVSCLAEDSKYIYAAGNDGYLLALDKADGHRVFKGVRKDLPVFAADAGGKTPVIYAATGDGKIISVGPVLRPGTMGELVLDTIPTPFQICLQ
jgi:outer membrane protein assembly factor BamB